MTNSANNARFINTDKGVLKCFHDIYIYLLVIARNIDLAPQHHESLRLGEMFSRGSYVFQFGTPLQSPRIADRADVPFL